MTHDKGGSEPGGRGVKPPPASRSPGSRGPLKIVVIGNGMVGQRFLEQLAPRGEFEITVFCEEPRPAYDRVQLTSFFSGKSAADLNLAKKEVFATSGRTPRLNRPLRRLHAAP